MKPLRVCINVTIEADTHSGVHQFVLGLTRALLKVVREDEEQLLFLATDASAQWLAQMLGRDCRCCGNPRRRRREGWRITLRRP